MANSLRKSVERTGGPASPGRRRFLKAGGGAALATLSTSAYAYEIEPSHPVVARHSISIAGWPAAAAGMKIGQLSDLHCQDERAVARISQAVQMLIALNPDIVLLTGDYISSGQGTDWVDRSAAALAPLRNVPHGVYAVLGNHDYVSDRGQTVTAALEQVGFHLLNNRAVPLPGAAGVWLVGLESFSMTAADPSAAFAEVPAEAAAKILLVHEPDYADKAPPGIGLQLSGHSHAGQIRLPGLPPLHCPEGGRKYPEGLQQAQNHRVYTSRGVGMMGPQMRLFCPPEVTLLTITPAER